MDVKERIMQRVNEINDPQLLDELLKAVELEHVEELTDPERKAIDEGITDAEAGRLHTNSEASQLVKEWQKNKVDHCIRH